MTLVASEIWVLLLAAAWLVVPGLAVGLAARVRDVAVLAGTAVPVSVALTTTAAVVCAGLGVRFGPLPAVVVAVAATGVTGVVAQRLRRAAGSTPWFVPGPVDGDPDGDTVLPAGGAGAARVVAAVGYALGGVSLLLGVATWWRAVGPLRTYNQDHDSVIHQLLSAYILDTGRAAPWQVLPADVLTGADVSPYPAGLHRIAALVGASPGDAVAGLNATLIVVGGVVWGVSVATLTVVVLRQGGVAHCWRVAGAGLTAVLAVGAYRPIIQYARDNGVMANAVALVLVPGLLAVLLSLRRPARGETLLAGLACGGVVAVHPSAAVSVLVSVVPLVAGALLSPAFRRTAAGWLRALVAVGGVAAVVSAPTLLPTLGALGVTTSFAPVVSGVPLTESLGRVATVPYGGFLDPEVRLVQVALLALVVAGLAGSLLLSRWLGLAAAWVTWVTLSVAVYADPVNGPVGLLAGVYYSSADRVQPHVELFVPSLGAIGVLSVVVLVRRAALAGGGPGLRRHTGVLTATVLVVLSVLYVAGPARGYLAVNTAALADRWSDLEFNRVSPDDLAAIDYLAENVDPGERVMNSANDGSTYAYVARGIPVVNVSTLGSQDAPYTYYLLELFNEIDTDPRVRSLVRELDIAWVYVDLGAPVIGSRESPDDWFDAPSFTVPPGLQGLDDVDALTLGFRSGEVSVYQVELDSGSG